MDDKLKAEKEWAEHMPSEGENMENVKRQSSPQGVQEAVRSAQNQQAAGSAPAEADPQAAEKNREFVEDTAMDYDRAEEQFAKGDR
jgi:hypothetical protein